MNGLPQGREGNPMNVTVIYGNRRKGSTWNAVRVLLEELNPESVRGITLPADLPEFCTGCFSCIQRGEDHCPHRRHIAPIVEALAGSDLLVLATPVYAMDVSGAMKNLLDHLCFMWMSHRPDPRMFALTAVTVSTTAGAGLKHTGKTLKNSLQFFGIRRILTLHQAVAASRWEEAPEKAREKIRLRARKLAGIIRQEQEKKPWNPGLLYRTFLFRLMRAMMKKNTWNLTDRSHWETRGWLGSTRPY